jgi:hypothetical protein
MGGWEDQALARCLRSLVGLSLIPAVVVVPLWLLYGRAWMGGGGWHARHVPLALACGVLHVMLLGTYLASGVLSLATPRTVALLLWYADHAWLQMLVADGGDGCDDGCPPCTTSLAEYWWGWDAAMVEGLFVDCYIALLPLAGLLLVLAVYDCYCLYDRNDSPRERPQQGGEDLPLLAGINEKDTLRYTS